MTKILSIVALVAAVSACSPMSDRMGGSPSSSGSSASGMSNRSTSPAAGTYGSPSSSGQMDPRRTDRDSRAPDATPKPAGETSGTGPGMRNSPSVNGGTN